MDQLVSKGEGPFFTERVPIIIKWEIDDLFRMRKSGRRISPKGW